MTLLFAAVLNIITIGSDLLLRPHSWEAGFPAFFCSLPMASYFAASARTASQEQVERLETDVATRFGSVSATRKIKKGIK